MYKKNNLKNREGENYYQMIMDNEVIKLFKDKKINHLVIIILYKGKKLPKYCAPMLRNPSPKINIPINNNLAKIYFSAIKKNPSVEDGAILIQVDNNTLILKGFSYRIYPPPLNVSRLKNLGSGYNSVLDFSGVKRIKCVYYINKKEAKKFINGKEKILCSKRIKKF
ncbi:hypothetical protein KAU19_06525 [Candidatus Parcubacteria bacterium]|nr:hypothetical protein [Candidatus Parcubacteria bacterium]